MRFQRFPDGIQVRLETGEEVMSSLLSLLRQEGVGFAAVTGLGSVRGVRLSYWNAQTIQYETHEVEEQLEVVSLVGNATIRDGEPFLHLHVSLGRRDLSMFGGHFNDAVVHPTLEVWLAPQRGVIERRVEPDTGLGLMQLPEGLGGHG